MEQVHLVNSVKILNNTMRSLGRILKLTDCMAQGHSELLGFWM